MTSDMVDVDVLRACGFGPSMARPSHRHRVDVTARPWVALVGAGPGDPDLLTRRAAELLAHADVVLYDRLAGPRVLALARRGAQLIDVGKFKGGGSSQRHIEQLLVAHHAAGRRVVRLKGGDPFVFGRGQEEVDAAHDAGFEVEVVPGVSSALSAPALAGISVTERGVSAQVTIVSGHLVEGEHDWDRLAAGRGTLVVLMGASTGPEIARRLLAGGMDSATPATALIDAGRPTQRTLTGTVADLAVADRLPSPCVLVIGSVAAR
ncbi:MAG: uroporphyrinogen-III C-methyltransferase [Desertimonas sp.]